MHSDTYRNGILTTIALLLAVLAWANVSEQSMLVSEAHAQIRSKPPGTARYPIARTEDEQGVSSIGQRAVVQRDELIASIESLRSSVEAIAARDPERAEAAARGHIARTLRDTVALLNGL